MARGSAVIEYRGKRGTRYRIKYVDGAGRQVMETTGGDPRQAEAALHDRLTRVEREAYRKPRPTTFGEAFAGWFEATSARKGWRESSRRQYRIVEARLIPRFGRVKLTAIRRADVSAYVTERLVKQAPATVSRDLTVLHFMAKAGHANMATTKVYLKLAGVVFREEAEQLERRLLGLSTHLSTHVAASEPVSADSAPLEKAVSA